MPLPRLKPGRRVSTRNNDTPLAPAFGSVLAQTITISACRPLVINTLAPLMRQPPSVRSAVVRMAARSLPAPGSVMAIRSEEHTSELQSRPHLVCRLLLEKKKQHQRQRQTASDKT